MDLPHNAFDLVIMNPPFTRPTNHEVAEVPVPSFAGFATSDEEMKHMSRRLKRIRTASMVGHGNAGLASNFIDLRPRQGQESRRCAGPGPPRILSSGRGLGGRPAALRRALSGCGGREHRCDRRDHLRLFGRHGHGRGTGRRDEARRCRTDRRARFVRQSPASPASILEAKTVARAVQRIPEDRSVGAIPIGAGERAGCSIRETLSGTGCAGLREADVARAATGLVRGELRLPRLRDAIPLHVDRLGELGDRGLLDRDINGPEISNTGLPRGPSTSLVCGRTTFRRTPRCGLMQRPVRRG